MVSMPVGTPESRAESRLTGSSFHTAHSLNSRRTTTTNSSAPDSEALAILMADLGIESWEEDEFGWVAEVGLRTAPPPRWNSRHDVESGATYYIDTDTQTSTWDNPLAPHLRKVVEVGRLYLANPLDGALFEEQERVLWAEHKTGLEGWHGPIEDDQGNSYFVNSREGTSSWQDPRLEAQYVFNVQKSLLRHLEGILAAEEDQDGAFEGAATPWETQDGAQVLSLGGFSPASRTNAGRKVARISRAMSMPEDHTFTLQQMENTANWMHDARQNEEEVQRLRLIRKVEERRVRKLSRKLSKAIHESVQGETEVDANGQERRIAWGQGKL